MDQITTMEQIREIIPAPSERAYAKLRERLCGQGTEFIRNSPFLVMSTVGSWGLEVTSKGDHPGFVDVVDDRTLLIPERKGNQLALSLGNILADPRVGLMFFRPATEGVLRISGRATLTRDADLCARLSARGEPALLVMRIDIDRAAFHCVKAARRAGLWEPEAWGEPTSISFGRIYAEALQRPEIEADFDRMTQISNSKL